MPAGQVLTGPGRPSRRRVLDAVVVAALAAVAVAVAVTAVAGGGGTEPAAAPPPAPETGTARAATAAESLPALVPLPGELREEGGRLWWSGDDCRAAFLDLSSAGVTRLPGRLCRIWPSPDGTSAVGAGESGEDQLRGRGLALVTAAGARRPLAHRPGLLAAEVAWSADSRSFAACFETRSGVVTQVYAPDRGRIDLEGACAPSFLADGRLAVASGAAVEVTVDGRALLDAAGIERILGDAPPGAALAVSALAAGGGLVAAGLVGVRDGELDPSASGLAVVDAGGKEVFAARLFPKATHPAAVGLAPGGGALWYRDVANERTVVLSVPGGRRLSFFPARWVAWSPDGRYLAAARRGAIVLMAWPGGERVAEIPVEAAQLAWTRTPPE